MHKDKLNNDKVYLVHDDNAYVELIHFANVLDNHTNDIENFVLLFQYVVLASSLMFVLVD